MKFATKAFLFLGLLVSSSIGFEGTGLEAFGFEKGRGLLHVSIKQLKTKHFYNLGGKKVKTASLQQDGFFISQYAGIPKNMAFSFEFQYIQQFYPDTPIKRGISDLKIGLYKSFAPPFLSTSLGLELSLPTGSYRPGDSLSTGDGEADIRYVVSLGKSSKKWRSYLHLKTYLHQRFKGYTSGFGYQVRVGKRFARHFKTEVEYRGVDFFFSANPNKISPYTGLGDAVAFKRAIFKAIFPIMGGGAFLVNYHTPPLGWAQNQSADGFVSLAMQLVF